MKSIKMSGVNTASFYHTKKRNEDGSFEVTCFSIEEIEPGDSLILPDANHTVLEIIENRDHKGVFENPLHKLNSFFKLKTKIE